MNNPIQQQTDLLGQLAQVMINSVHKEFDQIECCFDYFVDEETGDDSVGSQLAYLIGETRVGLYLNDPESKCHKLVAELNRHMREHTGGHWEKVFLTLGNDGKLNTKFQYPTANT
ncbi:MAG: hypothetical protein H7Y28_01875 [Rhodoferax sp.]|nr:hypothetical protein [Rhodoferax sp.]